MKAQLSNALSKRFHLFIEQVGSYSLLLSATGQTLFSAWVLKNAQHWAPTQGPQLLPLGSSSGSNIFL